MTDKMANRNKEQVLVAFLSVGGVIVCGILAVIFN
jgi:hypothetical protein